MIPRAFLLFLGVFGNLYEYEYESTRLNQYSTYGYPAESGGFGSYPYGEYSDESFNYTDYFARGRMREEGEKRNKNRPEHGGPRNRKKHNQEGNNSTESTEGTRNRNRQKDRIEESTLFDTLSTDNITTTPSTTLSTNSTMAIVTYLTSPTSTTSSYSPTTGLTTETAGLSNNTTSFSAIFRGSNAITTTITTTTTTSTTTTIENVLSWDSSSVTPEAATEAESVPSAHATARLPPPTEVYSAADDQVILNRRVFVIGG